MKKLTLLLVAALMITGGAIAQDKACCKKGHKGACCKDKKECSKDGEKSKTSNTGKSEPAKAKS